MYTKSRRSPRWTRRSAARSASARLSNEQIAVCIERPAVGVSVFLGGKAHSDPPAKRTVSGEASAACDRNAGCRSDGIRIEGNDIVESKAKFLGHPVHQMLVVFPLGLLATAVIFDVARLLGAGPTMVAVAYWTMAAGIVGALVAAPFGTVDWLAIPAGTRAKRVGALHGL